MIDKDLTSEILIYLLKTKGVRLPMASTILCFKNPNILNAFRFSEILTHLFFYLSRQNFQA
jgi:hypothetical protein